MRLSVHLPLSLSLSTQYGGVDHYPEFKRQWCYVGDAKTASGHHRDVYSLSAWLLQLEGYKAWRVAAPEPFPVLLSQEILKDDLWSEAGEKHGGWEAVLAPGECLWVGGTTRHQVRNETLSVAITHNYLSILDVLPVVLTHIHERAFPLDLCVNALRIVVGAFVGDPDMSDADRDAIQALLVRQTREARLGFYRWRKLEKPDPSLLAGHVSGEKLEALLAAVEARWAKDIAESPSGWKLSFTRFDFGPHLAALGIHVPAETAEELKHATDVEEAVLAAGYPYN